mmetsp:Transcript_67135/g.127884  ORF Transcript_67135/g.127884 Transcript_67135/m.127884 type:complete len:225 (+) Transcript_67135:937-1611(+)
MASISLRFEPCLFACSSNAAACDAAWSSNALAWLAAISARLSSIDFANAPCASSHAAFISAALLPCSASSIRKAACASSCAAVMFTSNLTNFCCKSPSSRVKMWIWLWRRFIWLFCSSNCFCSRESTSVCHAVTFSISSALGVVGSLDLLPGDKSPPPRIDPLLLTGVLLSDLRVPGGVLKLFILEEIDAGSLALAERGVAVLATSGGLLGSASACFPNLIDIA